MNETIGALSVLFLVLGGLYLMTRGLPTVVLVILGVVILSGAFPDSPLIRKLAGLVWALMPLLLVLGFLSFVFRWSSPGRRR